jgi:hypothetical protein
MPTPISIMAKAIAITTLIPFTTKKSSGRLNLSLSRINIIPTIALVEKIVRRFLGLQIRMPQPN